MAHPRIYRVSRWRELYEPPYLNPGPAAALEFVGFPVIGDQEFLSGLQRLAGQRKGAAYLGGWVALVRLTARTFPRGVLITPKGSGYDSVAIARETHLPSKLFDELIPLLAQEIGWLEPVSENDVAEIIDQLRSGNRLDASASGRIDSATKKDRGGRG